MCIEIFQIKSLPCNHIKNTTNNQLKEYKKVQERTLAFCKCFIISYSI